MPDGPSGPSAPVEPAAQLVGEHLLVPDWPHGPIKPIEPASGVEQMSPATHTSLVQQPGGSAGVREQEYQSAGHKPLCSRQTWAEINSASPQ